MKREDIQYFNSWAKSFRKCSPAQVMKGLLEGIWINSNKDPEDIYLIFPKLITNSRGTSEIDKQFGLCPFEFALDDTETWEEDGFDHKKGDYIKKGRFINSFGDSWWLDRYEARKAVTRIGLKKAKENKITKEEVIALHEKYGWDDEAAYKELMANRPDLMIKSKYSDYIYPAIDDDEYKYIRAAFIPHCDTLYNWMDHPEKAGIEYHQE